MPSVSNSVIYADDKTVYSSLNNKFVQFEKVKSAADLTSDIQLVAN